MQSVPQSARKPGLKHQLGQPESSPVKKVFKVPQVPKVDAAAVPADPELPKMTCPVNGQVAFMEKENLPVYKIGYDKYLSFICAPGLAHGPTRIMLSERKGPAGNPKMTGKGIAIEVPQFLKLYGLILSGATDLSDAEKNDHNLHRMFALGGGIFFQWSRYGRTNLATVRRFITLNNGDLIPDKVGLSFGQTVYDNLKKMFKEMVR
jgi:hypothetical protein